MRQILALLMATVMALTASADRFYIEDFDVRSGETKLVEILLNNEAQYTAFQTDLILPAGLSVEQEDDEYIIDLTRRKANDHSIMSLMRPDGSIRIAAFSMNVKAFSGNSGALVTFNLIADNDYSGPATIELRNSIFTTVDGNEVTFADEVCTLGPLSMPGDVNYDNIVDVQDVTSLISYVLGYNPQPFNESAADVVVDGVCDVQDVTALIAIILNHS